MSSAMPMPLADDSHLPSKKRKKPPSPPPHDNDSSSSGAIQTATNEDKNKQNDPRKAASAPSSSALSTPAVPAASLSRQEKEGNPSSRGATSASASVTTTIMATRATTTSRSNICPSRLPSKKRKGSQDSQQTSSTKNSSSSCVQFEDDVKGQRIRTDSAASAESSSTTQKNAAVVVVTTRRQKPAPPAESVLRVASPTITTRTSNSSKNDGDDDGGGAKKRNDADANKTSKQEEDDDATPPWSKKRKFSSEEVQSTALRSSSPRRRGSADSASAATAASSRDRLGSFSAGANDLLYGTSLHGGGEDDDVGVLLLPNLLHHHGTEESTVAASTTTTATTRARLDSFYAATGATGDLLSGSLHSHELLRGGGGAKPRKNSADSAASRTRLGSLLTSGSVNSDEAKAAASGKRKDSAGSASSIRARLHSFSVTHDHLHSGAVVMPNTSEASRARTDSVESIAARSRKSSTSMMNDLLVNALQEECGTSGQKRKDSGDDSQTAAAAAAATRSRKTSSSCMMDPPSTTASAAGPVVLLQHRAGRPRTRTNSVSSLENEEESLKQQRKMSQDSSISASSAHLGIPHDSTTDPSAAAAAAAAAPRQRNGSLSETGTGNSKSVIDALLPSQSFEDVESLPLPSHVADGPSFEDADSLPLPPLPLPPPPSLEPLAPLVLTGTTDDATLTPTMSNDSSNRVKRSKSGNASVAAAAAAAALEHLDALGGKLSASEKEAAATALSAAAAPGSSAPGSGPTAGVASMPNATTKGSLKEEEDEQSSAGTQTSSANQRLLYEAIMMTAGGGLMSTGGGGGAATIQGGDAHHGECGVTTGRERLESIGSFLDVAASFRNRDRLESWGGMSDLSLQLGGGGSDPSRPAWLHGAGGSSSANAAAAAATASTETNAAANAAGVPPAMDDVDLLDLFPEPARSVPSRISMARDRLNSVASLSEGSFTGFPILVDGVDMTLDVQAFVAAAMASVGDQLAELAGAVESAASLSGSTAPIDITAALAPLVENAAAAHRRDGDESETSSAAEPMIGAALEGGMGAGRGRRRPRSWSASSGRISVDYEAVAQAVDAAHAATGAVDVASIANSSSEETGPGAAMLAGDCSKKEKPRRTRRQLPLKRSRDGSDSDRKVKAAPTSKANEDIDQIRERARAAAGYVPPQQLASAASKKQEQTKASIPLKKRAKRPSPNPDRTTSNPPDATPRISNKTSRPAPERAPSAPLTLSADVTTSCSKQTKGQTNQKWDSMFECLVEFINERREEETTGQSEEDKNAWVWDGNVPTTHKAKDGKAIGRWVNNQRSAKGKGSLKGERLQRLESIGLKWSVLVSNSWNDAFGELQKYSDEQKKAGKEWDGNVPTNYQIKANPNGSGPQGEDRNLGRWVNRQRSLYQSGKLRKDRQLALEKMGLKWSMLASTSWESMYETFCEYVQQKKTSGVGGKSEWDGNVPATYRTNDNPPRSLGRWINRQRSAKMKNSLKKEYVDKLNAVGLKWSVHERCSSNDKQGEAGEVGNVGSCDGEKKPAFPPNGNAGECKADNVESSDVDKKPPPSINNKQGECKSNDTDDGGGCASVTNGSSNDKDCENKAGSDVSGGDAKTAKDSADDPQGEGKANHSSDVVEKNVSAVSVTKGKEN